MKSLFNILMLFMMLSVVSLVNAKSAKKYSPNITAIKNADWVVAWDQEKQTHTYQRNSDVVFKGNIIVFVGKNYNGDADNIIDGKGLMVMPGLINIHAHPGGDKALKGIDEYGADKNIEAETAWSEKFKLWEKISRESGPKGEHEEVLGLSSQIGYSELMLSGVTTVVDIAEVVLYPNWENTLRNSGLRGYMAPMIPWVFSLDKGLKFIDDIAKNDKSGRIKGLVLTTFSTAPGELLKTAHAEAKKRNIPFKIHASQSFSEVIAAAKKDKTPIQVLDELDILTSDTILAHATLFDNHPLLDNKPPYKDINIVAKSGAHVAHAPYAFALDAIAMDSLNKYTAAGINVGLGTDTFRHNMLEEMRAAMMLSRVMSGRINGTRTGDIFNAATIGGARALNRNDIGVIKKGAKADLVLIDLNNPAMSPNLDPLRSLIFQAADRAVRDVFIDGVKVVGNGEVLTIDHLAASKRLDEILVNRREKLVKQGKRDIGGTDPVYAFPRSK